tara:strand:+ start:861 stop:1034 length:174 start_codon:yes stop_codon:yes gene_type:complete
MYDFILGFLGVVVFVIGCAIGLVGIDMGHTDVVLVGLAVGMVGVLSLAMTVIVQGGK